MNPYFKRIKVKKSTTAKTDQTTGKRLKYTIFRLVNEDALSSEIY